MTVIKKSGKKEDFSDEKLLKSITAASVVSGEDINLKLIMAEFQQIVRGKELITTQQIDVIVNGLLYSKGLFGTLEQFVSYDKKR